MKLPTTIIAVIMVATLAGCYQNSNDEIKPIKDSSVKSTTCYLNLQQPQNIDDQFADELDAALQKIEKEQSHESILTGYYVWSESYKPQNAEKNYQYDFRFSNYWGIDIKVCIDFTNKKIGNKFIIKEKPSYPMLKVSNYIDINSLLISEHQKINLCRYPTKQISEKFLGTVRSTDKTGKYANADIQVKKYVFNVYFVREKKDVAYYRNNPAINQLDKKGKNDFTLQELAVGVIRVVVIARADLKSYATMHVIKEINGLDVDNKSCFIQSAYSNKMMNKKPIVKINTKGKISVKSAE